MAVGSTPGCAERSCGRSAIAAARRPASLSHFRRLIVTACLRFESPLPKVGPERQAARAEETSSVYSADGRGVQFLSGLAVTLMICKLRQALRLPGRSASSPDRWIH